jgi:membrane associated rhomboid family serine protease
MAFLRAGDGQGPLLKAPPAVILTIALLIAAHMARILAPAMMSDEIIDNYAFIPLRYAPNALEPGSLLDRAVPFVSYMFVHADWTHLAINCFWLLAFGSIVARRYGSMLFFVFFVTCGVASAALHLVLNWQSPAAVIGASGGISGLMAAGIRMLAVPGLAASEERKTLVPILSPQVLAFSLLWIVINLVFGLTGLSILGETQSIAWAAHLGGYFVGLLLSGPVDRLASRRHPDEAQAS